MNEATSSRDIGFQGLCRDFAFEPDTPTWLTRGSRTRDGVAFLRAQAPPAGGLADSGGGGLLAANGGAASGVLDDEAEHEREQHTEVRVRPRTVEPWPQP